MKTTNQFLALILLSCLFYSCNERSINSTAVDSSALVTEQQKIAEKPYTIPYDKRFDQTTRMLSGMAQEKESPIHYLDTMPSWKNFAKAFDSSWAQIEEKRFAKMRTWSKAELTAFNNDTSGVFYPFSGPDILNAFILFPKATQYTLLALEPIGELPNFSTMTERQRQEYYLSVELSLNDLLNKSYFITRNMLRDLQKHKVNGTLPLICVFLKRTGNTIIDIKKIGIDSSGNIVERYDSLKFKGTNGVQLEFLPKGEQKIRILQYFKCDLADQGIRNNKGLENYLSKLPTKISYLKSASYLLHYKEFSIVRKTIFEKSKGILQDDSGIAYHYYDNSLWDIKLYGKYAKPVSDFPHIKEPDLKAAYEQDTIINALPFELGYHWGTRESNMLRALRNK